jgi:four helix bundle protein
MPDWSRFTFGITFRPPVLERSSPLSPALGVPTRHDRVPIYQAALELASRIYALVDRADAERYFLRDQLDRKSALIPQLIAQGLATADMKARRALYMRARESLTDCAALLDLLSHRATVALDDLAPARALALTLIDDLLPLTVPPSRIW